MQILNIINVAAALEEYDASTKTQVEVNTAAATEAARLAAVNADLASERATDTLHALEHTSLIFPGNTNLTCTLTAAATANTFSDWVEIADSAATKFSTVFATYPGHITEFTIEILSEIDTRYMVEFACGEAVKVPLTAVRFAGGTKFDTPAPVQRLAMPEIPVACKLYYRMKTASAVADTAIVSFRYHVHT